VFRVLIGDDDVALCELLSECLQCEGFEVATVHDSAAVLQRLRDPLLRPDLLILDVMMPGQSGLDALRELRGQHRLPVIMLSARGEPVDRVIGLELGADDYMAKPCLPRELVARVRAHLRRHTPEAATDIRLGPLHLVPAERCAFLDGAKVVLTGAEFAILLLLVQHVGEVVDKASLTRLALGRNLGRFDRSIDMRISRLRQKLTTASSLCPRIESVRGSGYVLLLNEGAVT
jgi:two-component system, OmpR family, response regulator CpxR